MKKLILILVSIILVSCASRKVQVTNEVIKSDSVAIFKDTLAVKTTDSVYVKKDICADEIIITPIDASKSITVNGRTYKNASITIKKIKDNTLYSISKTKLLNASKIIENKMVKSSAVKSKQIEKKQSPIIAFLFWIAFAISLFLAFRYTRKLTI